MKAKLSKKFKPTIATKLQEVVGVASTGEEKVLQLAATEILSGIKTEDVAIKYALDTEEINGYLRRIFPTDDAKFTFLEDCMTANSMRAMAVFERNSHMMLPVEAAKAATMFAGKALEIKKARESGFKEAPTNPQTILNLEMVLNKLVLQQ